MENLANCWRPLGDILTTEGRRKERGAAHRRILDIGTISYMLFFLRKKKKEKKREKKEEKNRQKDYSLVSVSAPLLLLGRRKEKEKRGGKKKNTGKCSRSPDSLQRKRGGGREFMKEKGKKGGEKGFGLSISASKRPLPFRHFRKKRIRGKRWGRRKKEGGGTIQVQFQIAGAPHGGKCSLCKCTKEEERKKREKKRGGGGGGGKRRKTEGQLRTEHPFPP